MKIETLYRDILKKAFNITFKNKIFWFLGLFAAPLIGIGEYQILSHSFGGFSGGTIANWYPIVETGVFKIATLRYLTSQLIEDPISVLILLTILAVIVLLIFFVIWISIVAQGSLINGIDKTGSKRIASKLSPFISTGIERFWTMAGIFLFVKIIIAILLLLLSLPIIALAVGGNAIASGVFYFIFILIFIPLAVIAAFIGKYAINYVIIEKENLSEAIKKSYQLFIDNWLISIEMSIILLLISAAASLALATIGSLILIPIVLLIYFLAQVGILALIKVIILLVFLTLILVGIFFAAILSTFQYASWVLLFKEIHGTEGKIVGKLGRFFKL